MIRESDNDSISIGELSCEEELEENGICELPVTGTPIKQFSFENNSVLSNEATQNKTAINTNKISAPAKHPKFNNNHKDTKRSYPYGLTPPIDGEYFDTKRSFSFRESTVRKLNKLKIFHPDINVYLNTIIDIAICHYYEYIFKERDSQK